MAFEDPLINTLGPRVLDPIQKQFGYVMKVKWHVRNVTEAMDRLIARRTDVLLMIEEAERRQETPRNEVADWLQKVAEIEAKLGLIQERYRKRRLLFGCCGLNCWSTYRIGKGAMKKLAKVEKLIADGDFQEVAMMHTATAEEVPNPARVLGMESYLEKVLGYLDGGEEIIGIWGMGGVGKTTLLRSVNNAFLPNGERSTQFHHVIWVVASKELNLEKLQQDIANRIKLTLDKDATMKQRATIIHAFLKKKHFLLLLDDLWEPVDLSEVGIPHPRCGGDHKHRVILTTRSETVCGKMEAHNRLKVECLGWEEAWQLFKEKVTERTINSDPLIPALAKKVAEECDGLPLALITIGRAMSTKTKHQDWNHAITKLKSSQHPEISGQEGKDMLQLLKFSYDNLLDDTVKECFLLCSLWPEDHPIGVESIIECWMGLGLIDETDEIDNSYNKGHSLVTTLKEACLLEPGGNEDTEVKMHDVIRDLALWIASECGKKPNKWIVQAGVGLSQAPKLAEQWRRAEVVECLSLMNNPLKMLPQNLAIRHNLTILMLQKNEKLKEIPCSFFQCMPALTYLDLSSTIIEELPAEIGTLIGLQYLNLSASCFIKLPEELASLENLKHLLLKGTKQLSQIPSGVLRSLKNLQVLDLYASKYADWETEQGAHINELKSEFLKALGITVKSVSTLQMISMLPSEVSIRSLCIRRMPSPPSVELRPSTFNILFGNRNIMQTLHELTITSCSTLSQLMLEDEEEEENNTWSLAKLKNLDLINLFDLEVISLKREVAMKFLPMLRSLNIVSCYKLKSISWVLQLPCLETLEVHFCSEMKELISEEVPIEDIQLLFPRLKNLVLHALESLTCICQRVLGFPSLEIIDVTHCKVLKNLPIDSQIIEKKKLREIRGSEEWWNGLKWEGETYSSFLPYFRDAKN